MYNEHVISVRSSSGCIPAMTAVVVAAGIHIPGSSASCSERCSCTVVAAVGPVLAVGRLGRAEPPCWPRTADVAVAVAVVVVDDVTGDREYCHALSSVSLTRRDPGHLHQCLLLDVSSSQDMLSSACCTLRVLLVTFELHFQTPPGTRPSVERRGLSVPCPPAPRWHDP